jgi:hypothetical protein
MDYKYSVECRCSQEQRQHACNIFEGARQEPRSTSDATLRNSAHVTLDELPREILHSILMMVYDGEEKSQDLCRCSRPETSYKRVREIALEHRIVNTVALRSVCPVFHAWTLHEILRNHLLEGNMNPELEVDFSSIKRLTKKLGGTPDCIIQRLADDFLSLNGSGVTIYLGDPGAISNMRTVVNMLSESDLKIFSGATFWDVDRNDRECHPEFQNLLEKALLEGKRQLI